MADTTYRLEYYLEDDGRAPFTVWLSNIHDRDAHARISARLNRLKLGNFGVVKLIGKDNREDKVHGQKNRKL